MRSIGSYWELSTRFHQRTWPIGIANRVLEKMMKGLTVYQIKRATEAEVIAPKVRYIGSAGRAARMASHSGRWRCAVPQSLPTVSVLVPCYNAERYLGQALNSVAAQTLAPLECIVVDDGSTDASARIAASYGPPFRLIRQANRGRAAAMNRAIGEAHGDLIMFLDADDFWLPEMIAAQVGTMVRTGADMVYAHAIRCDENGADLPTSFPEPVPQRCLTELLHSNRLNGCGACVRTDVLRQVGGFDGRFWPADDYHLWLRIAVEHRIANQPDPLGRYRYYSGQASAGRLRMALVQLGAKLDFLRRHRQVRRQLGRTLIRQAVEDPFFATLQRWHAAGQQRAARRLARVYLRHWPGRLRGWRLALECHLPWRVYARLVIAPRRCSWDERLRCGSESPGH